MKYLLFVLLCSSLLSLAQSREEMTLEYCRLWGLVKYYHPDIASGKTDWDQAFLKAYPEWQQVHSQKELTVFLNNLLETLSPPAKRASATEREAILQNRLYLLPQFSFLKNKDKYPIQPRFDWLKTSFLDESIKEQVLSIIASYIPAAHQGCRWNPPAPLLNEKTYTFAGSELPAYSLLGLFRFWNGVQYFYPYHASLDKPWENALLQTLPHFMRIRHQSDYIQAVKILAANMHDTHTLVWEEDPAHTESENEIASNKAVKEESETEYVFPFEMAAAEGKLIVNRIINDSVCRQYSLQPGDILTDINGKTFDEWKTILKPAISVSRPEQIQYNAAFYLNYWLSDTLTLNIDRKDSTQTITIYKAEIPTAIYDSMLHPLKYQVYGDIGYVNVYYLSNKEEKKAFKELKKCNAIILDMRGYPDDNSFSHFPYRLTNTFKEAIRIDIPYTHTDKLIAGVFQFRGKTGYHSFLPKALFYRKYKGLVVALIDEQVQSAAETDCMKIQANRKDIVFIGRNTAAANGNVFPLYLPGGIAARFAVTAASYPDGRRFQRIGIQPQLIVKPTIAGVRSGKDEILEKALEYIKNRD